MVFYFCFVFQFFLLQVTRGRGSGAFRWKSPRRCLAVHCASLPGVGGRGGQPARRETGPRIPPPSGQAACALPLTAVGWEGNFVEDTAFSSRLMGAGRPQAALWSFNRPARVLREQRRKPPPAPALIVSLRACHPCRLFCSPPVLGHPANLASKALRSVLNVAIRRSSLNEGFSHCEFAKQGLFGCLGAGTPGREQSGPGLVWPLVPTAPLGADAALPLPRVEMSCGSEAGEGMAPPRR